MILCFHQYARVHEQTKRQKLRKEMVKEEPFIFLFWTEQVRYNITLTVNKVEIIRLLLRSK